MDKLHKASPTSDVSILTEPSKRFNTIRNTHSFTLSYGNRQVSASGWGLVALIIIAVIFAALVVNAGSSPT
ncbi:MAG: hypothetical protein ABJL67_21540 [Sulfitobacter sp.]